ncbi:uncharacterized protein [Nicotiana tomentosiformis]|uniref:uncharacterized protein n=1 Tax=Nicotiana tomentosiformis TaxID=4098 RepID=UPI00051B6FE5|nr:uncharacterized protein LOC104115174 [Nicotiana tomentosiformis]
MMDCNKEEAIRARGIAEKKMENRDFIGAKKLLSKAQELFPNLENIAQMVLVCDVHCSAENKTFGNERNWYDILKVEPTADDSLIRKQYRKLALLLHPDKNKFPGAADAFTLIGEAQMVLLDREKRMLYNNRRIPSGRSQVPMQQTSSSQPDIRSHPWVQNKFNVKSEFMNQHDTQSGVPRSQPTFWTVCPFCSVKYKYYKTMLNKLLWCQNCKKSYTGHEVNASDATPGTSRSQPTSKKNDTTNQDHIKVSSQYTCMSPATKRRSQKKAADEFIQSKLPSEVGRESNSNGNSENAYGKINKEGLSGECKRKNTKRKKISVESSENCDSSTSIDSEEDVNFEECDHPPGQNSQCLGDQKRRRYTRSRQRVTYCANLSGEEEEEEDPSIQNLSETATPNEEKKKLKESLSSEESLQNTEQEAENANARAAVPEKGCGQTFDLPSDLGPSIMTEPESFEYPDPDFNDFEKDREESCFKVGQVWAVYDTLDAMPRFYAVIRKIFSPAFKLRITWLEPDPLDKNETKWLSEGFPASCGRFKLGNSEYAEDHPMFSHLACAKNESSCSNTMKIFPRQGETWAIFKDWDMNWYSHIESKKKYNYEFVEVLSDYADDIGAHVAYLGKVKGFTCLFHRAATKLGESGQFLIPAKEIFRFSHRVPSFKMTGMERNDVPEGSFELDPASLPIDQLGISVSADLDVEHGNAYNDVSCPRSPAKRVRREAPSLPKSNAGFENYLFSSMNSEPMAKSDKDISPLDMMEQWDDKPHDVLSPADGVEVKLKSEGDTSSVDLKGKSEGNAHPADRQSRINLGNNLSLDQRETANCMMYSRMDSVNSAENCIASVANEVPEPEFHNFDVERSLEKFQVGQFWAIYGDEDAMPRYYGQIKKIDPFPNFTLHVAWFYACPPPKGIIQWRDKTMPISCGMFKFKNRKLNTYTETNAFSHQVGPQPMEKKGVYKIFPRTGEVWAVYKNWSAQLKCDKLEDCEYEIVEVVDVTDKYVSLKFLIQVNGFKSVYKPQVEEEANGTVKISLAEQLRFSHQIPAFRLTEERGGIVRGFWEFDPAAMPVYFLCTD